MRPIVAKEDKKCLATYSKVERQYVWTLWDSGSTMTGLTPAFAQVTNIGVFLLMDPHILQLGTIGSRSIIKYGTEVEVEMAGQRGNIYADIANFNCYDMIVGCSTMRVLRMQLDFTTNEIVVNGIWIAAVRVPAPDADSHAC